MLRMTEFIDMFDASKAQTMVLMNSGMRNMINIKPVIAVHVHTI